MFAGLLSRWLRGRRMEGWLSHHTLRLKSQGTPCLSEQELKTKKRYGRLQKAMGDYCLLAGSPLDAQDHYSTGVDSV